jgi:hypothetical protein
MKPKQDMSRAQLIELLVEVTGLTDWVDWPELQRHARVQGLYLSCGPWTVFYGRHLDTVFYVEQHEDGTQRGNLDLSVECNVGSPTEISFEAALRAMWAMVGAVKDHPCC